MDFFKFLMQLFGSDCNKKNNLLKIFSLLFVTLLSFSETIARAEVDDPYTGPDLKYPEISLSAENVGAADVQGPISVTISSLNAQSFPFVFIDVDATDESGTCLQFAAENIIVEENGIPQTGFYTVTPPNENQGVRLVDVVFIMDNSGSMGGYQSAIKNNVYGFVDKLDQAGINYAFGLTRYGQATSSGSPIIEDNGNLTSDAAYFKDNLWTRNTVDGGREPGYWAIVDSASKFSFRPGSRRVFIIITDESPNQGGATLDQTTAALQSGDVTLFAVTNESLFSSFWNLVADPTQQLISLTTSFDQILTKVTDLLANTYRVTYKAQDVSIDGLERTVDVQVMCGSNSGWDTTTYVPGSEPKITRNQETVDLSTTAQPASTALTITVQVNDQVEPFVDINGVKLYYRPTTSDTNGGYKSVVMTNVAGDIYSAEIISMDVTAPGVDYYVTATDGEVTSSLPSNNSVIAPFQIAVWPNEPPVITHTLVSNGRVGQDLLISASISDGTEFLVSALLYWRRTGTITYTVQEFEYYGDLFETVIPGNNVTEDGIQYYLVARDNYGMMTTEGNADNPFDVTITTGKTIYTGIQGGGLDTLVDQSNRNITIFQEDDVEEIVASLCEDSSCDPADSTDLKKIGQSILGGQFAIAFSLTTSPSFLFIASPGNSEIVKTNISNNYEDGDPIVLTGFSVGGGDLQNLLKKLNELGIPVELSGHIDSVEVGSVDARIPDNTKEARGYYQKQSARIVWGEDNIVAVNSSETTTSNTLIKDPQGPSLREGKEIKWADHRNMDNDYRVWGDILNGIEEVFAASLNVREAANSADVPIFVSLPGVEGIFSLLQGNLVVVHLNCKLFSQKS